MSRFNCHSEGDTLDKYTGFYIAPCRNDSSHPETETVQCDPGEAEWWSIYGWLSDGPVFVADAIHDERNEIDIVRIAKQIAKETEAPFTYRDEWNGATCEVMDFSDLADWLTGWIHDDLPDTDAEEFREDDFDNHALAGMREAFVTYSDHHGLNTARDPYLGVPA